MMTASAKLFHPVLLPLMLHPLGSFAHSLTNRIEHAD
jgi:hypothetical protein